MDSKKGQGLSLNVIIIAALALIVLVVLIVVFTGRIGVFEKGVSKESQAELIKMKITYGNCKPSATTEAEFNSEFGQATTDSAKEIAKAKLKDEISRCKAFNSDKNVCQQNSCSWE